MRKLQITLALAAVFVIGTFAANQSQAQVFVYGPSVGIRVAPPMIPGPYPVVAYPRTYVAPPVVAYRSYRPVVAAPVYSPVVRVRPTVVGPGIGGFPNVYVPGQPLRNALRFTIP